MIAIDRGPEPDSLRVERLWRLPKAILAFGRVAAEADAERRAILDDLARKGLERGYQATGVLDTLYERQYGKCAYCERAQRRENQDIEHFRPRKGVAQDDGTKDDGRYWWLTWTWENLLFACGGCNGPAVKGSQFPLATGSMKLNAEEFSLSIEDRLLIDPAVDDPMDHIIWLPEDDSLPEEDWQWVPQAKMSDRGAATIICLRLRFLSRMVSKHIATHVLPKVKRLRAAKEDDVVREIWTNELALLFDPWLDFHAATYDALDYWFGDDTWQRKLMRIRRPSVNRATPSLPTGIPHPPPTVPRDAWLRILAEEELPEAIILLCEVEERRITELCTLLQRKESTIKDYVRQAGARLIQVGDVVRTALIGGSTGEANDSARAIPSEGIE